MKGSGMCMKNSTRETLNRLLNDCLELIDLSKEPNTTSMDGFILYIPFIDKRLQVLEQAKKEVILQYGIFIKPYIDNLLLEIENLLEILATKEIKGIQERARLLVSICLELNKKTKIAD